METSVQIDSGAASEEGNRKNTFELRYSDYAIQLRKLRKTIDFRLKNQDELFNKNDRLGKTWYRLHVEGEEMRRLRALSINSLFAYNVTVAALHDLWSVMMEANMKEDIKNKATFLSLPPGFKGHDSIDLHNNSNIDKEKILRTYKSSNGDIHASVGRIFLYVKNWCATYAAENPALVKEEELNLGMEIAKKRWAELYAN